MLALSGRPRDKRGKRQGGATRPEPGPSAGPMAGPGPAVGGSAPCRPPARASGAPAVECGRTLPSAQDESLIVEEFAGEMPGQPADAPVVGRGGTEESRSEAGEGCALEVGSGNSLLAKNFAKLGIPTLVVDHFTTRKVLSGPTIKVDLRSHEGWSTPYALLASGKLAYVHIEPPRHTMAPALRMSRQRGKEFGPRPKTSARLRTRKNPDGLSETGKAQTEVLENVNLIVKGMVAFARECVDKGVDVTFGSPVRSMFWKTSAFTRFKQDREMKTISFPFCAFGGHRLAYHRLDTTLESLGCLQAECSRDHDHRPADQPDSGAYPMGLRSKIADKVAERFGAKGFALNVVGSPPPPSEQERAAAARAASGRQPRGAKFPQLIPEYAEIREFDLPKAMVDDLGLETTGKLVSAAARALGVPPESRVKATIAGEVGRFMVSIGIPHTVEEFNRKAVCLRHPFDDTSSVAVDILKAIFLTLTLGPTRLGHWQNKRLEHYMRRAAQLAKVDAQRKKPLPESSRNIIAKKRVSLFGEMCRDAGVHDEFLEDQLLNGFSLAGKGSDSPEFPSQECTQLLSTDQVRKAAQWVRAAAASRKRPPEDDHLANAVWEKTAEEIAKGWLEGPYTYEQLLKDLGEFTVSRRFGVPQGKDVRVIDDYSESLCNAAFASPIKVKLAGLDEIAVTAKAMLEAVRDDRTVRVRLPDGKCLEDRLSEELTVEEARSLAVRVADLKSAYKQLLVSADSRWASVVQVWNTALGKHEFYVTTVLPFGATAAVYGFSRMADAIRKIGTRLLGLVWSNFFDDFTQLDISKNGDQTKVVAEKLFALLGWDFATKETKRLPFARRADVLGAVVDLSESQTSLIKVSNKPSRVEDLEEAMSLLRQTGWLSQPQAASLKGRLVFAEGQLFSRASAVMMPELRRRTLPGASGAAVNPALLEELEWMREFLISSIPRCVVANSTHAPAVVMTDAYLSDCCSKAGIGAVLLDARGSPWRVISEPVPEDTLALVQSETKFVITALEVLPVFIARYLWPEVFVNRRVFFFVDNDGARHSLIKSASPAPSILRVLRNIVRRQARDPAFLWFCRVPSASNVADGPSRGDCVEAVKAGATRTSVPDLAWREALE